MLITATPVLQPWISALSTNWGSDDGDTLIVLGGDFTGPGLMGVNTYWRCGYAVATWRAGHFRHVVVSGKDVAEPMRDFLVSQGIPRDAIVLEDKSNSTRENALFVAQLLQNDPGRRVLVTSDYHMFRALRAFRKVGIDVSPLPYPDARRSMRSLSQRWAIFALLAGETTKLVWYKFRSWI
jgi:uncharacterized SAM-binding protein YcdF (DUF218 family)